MNRNVLLIEPNYKNKYPPIGLMKLATYHRQIGDNVSFFKGEMEDLVLEELTNKLLLKFKELSPETFWLEDKNNISAYIKSGKKQYLREILLKNSFDNSGIFKTWLNEYSTDFRKKIYQYFPKFDRICITTLFTFEWKRTIQTINFAKNLVNNLDEIWVGGTMSSIIPEQLKLETGLKNIHAGLLNSKGILDADNDLIIDELPLDYSILDEIEYKYPESQAYYGYLTRGCKRTCSFCAVHKIEPLFISYVPINEKFKYVKEKFGEQRNLLLLDNNVLASEQFDTIIDNIKENGFFKGAKYEEPNFLEIAISNLKSNYNDKAYLKKAFYLFHELLNKLNGKEQKDFYNLLADKHLLGIETAMKENIVEVYSTISELYEKHRNKGKKLRYVDFNQGLDARFVTEAKMKKLSEIPINPLRIALDSTNKQLVSRYKEAVELAAKYGIRNLSNYLLYNFKDRPQELYERLKLNIDLCEKYDIMIYSFPMKYHDIKNEFKDRNYIGKYWNRKFIRAIQAILNSTKGKIGRDAKNKESFFETAFGKDIDEFNTLLYMPESYIIYRFFFIDRGKTDEWKTDFKALKSLEEKEQIKVIKKIETNVFDNIDEFSNPISLKLLSHYSTSRNDIINPNSETYKAKQKWNEEQEKIKQMYFKL